MSREPLGWFGIFRLGLVQAALGSIVVLATSTMNRVMVVELALPAIVPGALVGLHYALQILRPRMGHGSDGGRRTPWIVGGMALLALGGVTASASIALMGWSFWIGLPLAILGFVLVGAGVAASGTAMLVLMAVRVDPGRRAAAATITWVTMIVGFIVTTIAAGQLLDPYSHGRLIAVTAGVGSIAFIVTCLAVRGLEGEGARIERTAPVPFRQAFAQVWAEPTARAFTIFIFVSMLAYSAQDLILEPFAGLVFSLSPGETTKLSGTQHGGVLVGMIAIAVVGTLLKRRTLGSLRLWTVLGCLASALALAALAAGSVTGPPFPIKGAVFLLGMANGAFAVAAIGSMMERVGAGREQREGVRMGLWGASQAIAFGVGGFAGTLAADVARWIVGDPAHAYGAVFGLEALLFIAAARLAWALDMEKALARAEETSAPRVEAGREPIPAGAGD